MAIGCLSWLGPLGSLLATCCGGAAPAPAPAPSSWGGKWIVDNEVFHVCGPAHNPRVDIVFFHGLQLGSTSYKAAYYTTWVSKVRGKEGQEEEVCWPREWLGDQDFPDARILFISYDARAHGEGVERPRDTARALLRSMVELADVGQQRPAILVGHSLGGLIIKLICKEAREMLQQPKHEKYNEFLCNLLGAFFLATPHGGAVLAATASRYLGSVLNLAPALHFLAKDNYQLLELSEDFNRSVLTREWKVAAFAEVLPVQFGRISVGVVVPLESVRFDRVGQYTTIKDADHFSICKPQSKSHACYAWIHKFVTEMLQTDEAPQNVDRPYRAVRALSAGDEQTLRNGIRYIEEHGAYNASTAQLMDAGAMSPLLAVLRDPATPFQTKSDACRALEKLCYDRDRGRGSVTVVKEAGAQGAVKALVDFMVLTDAQGKPHEHLAAALHCLGLVAFHGPENRERLQEQLPTAKPLLQKLATSVPCSGVAKDILQSMRWDSFNSQSAPTPALFA